MGALAWWSSFRAGILYALIGLALLLVYFGQSTQAFEMKVYAQSVPTQLQPVIMKRLESQGTIKVGEQMFSAGPATITIQNITCPTLTLNSAMISPVSYDRMNVSVEDIHVECGGQLKIHLGPYTSDWHDLSLLVNAHAFLNLLITQARVGGHEVHIYIGSCDASIHAYNITIANTGVFSPIIDLGAVQDAIAARVDEKLDPEVCGIIDGVVGESGNSADPHAPLPPDAPVPDRLDHQKYELEKEAAELCANTTVLIIGGASYSVWEGVHKLYDIGQTLLATTLLIFSGVWPYVKLGVLFVIHSIYLVCPNGKGMHVVNVAGAIVEVIGKWSMVDVLFTGLLVATLRLGFISHFAAGAIVVYPREGALIYSLAVALSLIISYIIISGGPQRRKGGRLRLGSGSESYPELSMDSEADEVALAGRLSPNVNQPRTVGGYVVRDLQSAVAANAPPARQQQRGEVVPAFASPLYEDDVHVASDVPPERIPLRATMRNPASLDAGSLHLNASTFSDSSSVGSDGDRHISAAGRAADICISWPVSLIALGLVVAGTFLPLFTVTKVIDIQILASWDIPPALVQTFSVYSLAQYVAAREPAIMTCTGRRAAMHAIIPSPHPPPILLPAQIPNQPIPVPFVPSPDDFPSSPKMLPAQGPATFGNDPLPIVPQELPIETFAMLINRMLAAVTVVFFVCTVAAPILRASSSFAISFTHTWPVAQALGLPSDSVTRRRRFLAMQELLWSWDMVDVMYLGLVLLFLRLEEMVHTMSSGYCTFFLTTNLREYPAVWMLLIAIQITYIQCWAARILHRIDGFICGWNE